MKNFALLIGVAFLATIAMSSHADAQVIYFDQLKSWVPSSGTCGYGPYTAPAGNTSCSLSGSCYNGLPISVQASETWACTAGVNTVSGGAYLLYEASSTGSYPAGEFAWADATPSISGVTYPAGAEADCDGFGDYSGPVPYSC